MKILEFLKGNWGLKLLAFILAVVIYCTIHYAIGNESAGGGRIHDRRIFQQPL